MAREDAFRAALQQVTFANGFRRYNCHSIGFGPKEVNGRPTDAFALQFFVVCKLPLQTVPTPNRIPRELRVTISDSETDIIVPTDVIELPAPEVHALPPGAVHRPVPGGVRIWSSAISEAGTLGGWVWDNTDESIVFLSNQHVLTSVVGSAIHQPNSSAANRIGQVKRFAATPFEGPVDDLTPDDCNFADAAIASVDDTDDVSLTVLEQGPAVFQTAQATLFMAVQKYGQITELTEGSVVTTIDYNTTADFLNGQGNYLLCDNLIVRPIDPDTAFSSKGDSGSLVFQRSTSTAPVDGLHAVGLLWGGGGSANAQNQYSICSKIGHVFSELNIDVLCAGGFEAFLDALFDDQPGDTVRARVASLFKPRRAGPRRFSHGLARSVQARLRETRRGKVLVDMLQKHRAEALTLLIRSGDVRRSAIHALTPVLRGTVTLDQLFDRKLSKDDCKRLELFVDAVDKHGSKTLRTETKTLRRFLKDAEDKRIGDVV